MESNNDKCTCDKSENAQESDSSNSDTSPSTKDKKNKISLQSISLHLRRGRSLHFRPKRSKKCGESTSCSTSTSPNSSINLKKAPMWGLRFNCSKKEPKIVSSVDNQNCCKCTCYRRTEEHHLGAGVVFTNEPGEEDETCAGDAEACVNEKFSIGRPDKIKLDSLDNDGPRITSPRYDLYVY